MDENKQVKGMSVIFENKNAFHRFLIAALLIVIVIILIIEYATWRISSTSMKISFSDNGAAIVIDSANKLRASFSLPASARWTNSGIRIPPKTKIKILQWEELHWQSIML